MPVSERLFIYAPGKYKRQPTGSQFRIDPKRQTETRLILKRKELNRENPSHVGRERKQPSSTRMYLSGEMAGKIDTFCLRGRLYMERSDTPISA